MNPFRAIILITSVGCSWAAGVPKGILNLDEVPPNGVTQVWSPLFQASWDQLNERQKGALKEVMPPNDLITAMSEFQWKIKEVMPQDGYAVYAGPATREFTKKTADSIKAKFKVEFDPGEVSAGAGGKVAYGILRRDLKFKKKFYRSREKALTFRTGTGETREVAFFGTAGRFSGGFHDEVKVLQYDPAVKSFVLSIATDHEGESLIIFRPDQKGSFRQAIEHVKQAVATPLAGPFGTLRDGSLHGRDIVKIPYVTLNTETDFCGELGGDLYYEGDPVPWNVAKAVQIVGFQLVEDGAKVRVETRAEAQPFGDAPKLPPVVPRHFICDEPFFVFMWRDGANWPYFVSWIDGGEGLQAFPKN